MTTLHGCPGFALAAAVAVVVAVLLVETGTLKIPLPRPADYAMLGRWHPAAPFTSSRPQVRGCPDGTQLKNMLQAYALKMSHLAVAVIESFKLIFHAPETVAVDAATGNLLLPDRRGDVHLATRQADGSYSLQRRPIARAGLGRILGSKLDGDGNLVMCDVFKGLLRLNTSSWQVEVLASRTTDDSSSITYANGLDIAANGSIFFTSSTDIMPARTRDGSYDTGFAWALSYLRGEPRGRVLVWHPHTRRAHLVASGFFYPDGILVSDDGSHVLVVETDALRVVKLWLAGHKAGTREVIIHSLPGLPAGLSKASDGNLWLSMTTPLPVVTRYLRPILLRALVAWMPRAWRPAVRVWGAAMKITRDGKVLQVLLDPTGHRVATSSAATETNGRLFLGNLMGGPFISYVEMSAVQQAEDLQLLQLQGRKQSAWVAPHLGVSPRAPSRAGNSAGIDWQAVGGRSLHQQRDIWGEDGRDSHLSAKN